MSNQHLYDTSCPSLASQISGHFMFGHQWDTCTTALSVHHYCGSTTSTRLSAFAHSTRNQHANKFLFLFFLEESRTVSNGLIRTPNYVSTIDIYIYVYICGFNWLVELSSNRMHDININAHVTESINISLRFRWICCAPCYFFMRRAPNCAQVCCAPARLSNLTDVACTCGWAVARKLISWTRFWRAIVTVCIARSTVTDKSRINTRPIVSMHCKTRLTANLIGYLKFRNRSFCPQTQTSVQRLNCWRRAPLACMHASTQSWSCHREKAISTTLQWPEIQMWLHDTLSD